MKLNLKSILSMIVIVSLIVSSIMFVTSAAPTDNVSIITQSGEMETIYAEWLPVTGADSYNVYLKDAGGGRNKINANLVRKYKNKDNDDEYFRADAVGLRPGNYSLEIIPVASGSELGAKKGETSSQEVISYDRAGFSFESSLTQQYVGGYSRDGTLPSEAQVLYISDKTKDSITHDVITDAGKGTVTSCKGIGEILTAREKSKAETTPLVIRILGKVTAPSGINSSGFLQVKATQNVTIEGIGNDATVHGWGFLVRNSKNIEIRNLAVMWFKDDALSLDTGNEAIWLHDNDLFYGQKGGDSDQAKGDGSVDIKAGSKDVTVSYNHFWDSGKASLNGMSSEKTDYKITYHHNWFDHSDSRHPRTRTMTTHVYNNYYDGVAKYGVGVTMNSSTFVENNYFRNTKRPMLISLQGSDLWDDDKQSYTAKGTFSSESGGIIKAYGNYIDTSSGRLFLDQNSERGQAGHFDAVVVNDRYETVPSSYKSVVGGYTYNNFDTDASMYSYNVETAENAKNTVEEYAGRIQGGDFKWTFNNATDDTSYDVDTSLSNAVANYVSMLVLEDGSSDGGGEIPGDILPSAAPTVTPTPKPSATPTPTQDPSATPTPKPTSAPSEIDNGEIVDVKPYSAGDVNGDGFINSADAAIVEQYFLNKKKLSLTATELEAADVNDDGEINFDDASEIMAYVLTGRNNYIGK